MDNKNNNLDKLDGVKDKSSYNKGLAKLKVLGAEIDEIKDRLKAKISIHSKMATDFLLEHLEGDPKLVDIYDISTRIELDASTLIRLLEASSDFNCHELLAVATIRSTIEYYSIDLPDIIKDKALNTLDMNYIYNYIRHINTFDSIELLHEDNIILNSYPYNLINDDLRDKILNVHKTRWAEGISHIDKEKGIYMIVANIMKNNKKDVLVYNYIKYPDELLQPLLIYIMSLQTACWPHKNYNIGNDYLFLLEDKFKKSIHNYDNICFGELFDNNSKNNEESHISPRHLIDVYKLVAKGTLLQIVLICLILFD